MKTFEVEIKKVVHITADCSEDAESDARNLVEKSNGYEDGWWYKVVETPPECFITIIPTRIEYRCGSQTGSEPLCGQALYDVIEGIKSRFPGAHYVLTED